jgi:hypothetical protein
MKAVGKGPTGTFESRRFPRGRDATIDFLNTGRKKNLVPMLIEVDVTAAREALRKRKEATGKGLSFTGWAAKCVAQAVSEHKGVHAMRRGRSGLILFDDVDINMTIERPAVGSREGDTLPIILVIRQANMKSLEQIHAEIRAARSRPLEPGEQIISLDNSAPRFRIPATSSSFLLKPWMARLIMILPYTLRRILVWDRMLRDPFFAKEMMGTVEVTSVGMFGRMGSGGSWAMPATTASFCVAIGGIARRPAFVNGQIAEREYLSLTLIIDHDVIDGGPVARFAVRLTELMEGSFGLAPHSEASTEARIVKNEPPGNYSLTDARETPIAEETL